MNDILKKEFEYFLKHQDELVKKYKGKIIVIKDESVLGAYENDTEAINNTSKNHELGTFLVQLCESGDACYTQKFNRVVFS